MNPVISIIVPVYNVEIYIRKCLDSILNQTFKDFELILIDDGSPDMCGVICDEYKNTDSRIIVIHQRNSGISMARNAGLNIAKGKFIAFVDSDDYIHNQMYEIMLSAIIKYSADIVICDYYNINEKKNQMINNINTDSCDFRILSSFEDKRKFIYIDKYLTSVLAWNKLFKRKLFENIRFPEGRIYEDEATLFKPLYFANRIAYTDSRLYYYVHHDNSITSEPFSQKRFLRLDAIGDKMRFYLKMNEMELFSDALFVYKTDLLKITSLIFKEKDDNNEFKKHVQLLLQYKKIYNSYCLKYLYKLPISKKNKLIYIIYCFFPKIYYKRYVKKYNCY